MTSSTTTTATATTTRHSVNPNEWLSQLDCPPLIGPDGVSLRPTEALAPRSRSSAAAALNAGAGNLMSKMRIATSSTVRANHQLKDELQVAKREVNTVLGLFWLREVNPDKLRTAFEKMLAAIGPLVQGKFYENELKALEGLVKHTLKQLEKDELISISEHLINSVSPVFLGLDGEGKKPPTEREAPAQRKPEDLRGLAAMMLGWTDSQLLSLFNAQAVPDLKKLLEELPSSSMPGDASTYSAFLMMARTKLKEYGQTGAGKDIDLLVELLSSFKASDAFKILEKLSNAELLSVIAGAKRRSPDLLVVANGMTGQRIQSSADAFGPAWKKLQAHPYIADPQRDNASPHYQKSVAAQFASDWVAASMAIAEHQRICQAVYQDVKPEMQRGAKNLKDILRDLSASGRLKLDLLEDDQLQRLGAAVADLNLSVDQGAAGFRIEGIGAEIARRKKEARAVYIDSTVEMFSELSQFNYHDALIALKRSSVGIKEIRGLYERLDGAKMSAENVSALLQAMRDEALAQVPGGASRFSNIHLPELRLLIDAMNEVARGLPPEQKLQAGASILAASTELNMLCSNLVRDMQSNLPSNVAIQPVVPTQLKLGMFGFKIQTWRQTWTEEKPTSKDASDALAARRLKAGDELRNAFKEEFRKAWRAEGIDIATGNTGTFYVVSGQAAGYVRAFLEQDLREAVKQGEVTRLNDGSRVAKSIIDDLLRSGYSSPRADGSLGEFENAQGGREAPAIQFVRWLRDETNASDPQILTISHIANQAGMAGINSSDPRYTPFQLPNGRRGRMVGEGHNDMRYEVRAIRGSDHVMVKCRLDINRATTFELRQEQDKNHSMQAIVLKNGGFAQIEFEVEVDRDGAIQEFDPRRHLLNINYSAEPCPWAAEYGADFPEPHEVADVVGSRAHRKLREAMLTFCKKTHRLENIDFLDAMAAFKEDTNPATAVERASTLAATYYTKSKPSVRMDFGSAQEPDQINISAELAAPVHARLLDPMHAHLSDPKLPPPTLSHAEICELFAPSVVEIGNLLRTNDFPLFKKDVEARAGERKAG